MAGQDIKFIKGMNKDTGRIDQIDNTYRDALNAVLENQKGSITSEYGNSFVASLKFKNDLYEPVGQIALSDDNFVIFAVNGEDSAIFHINSATHTSTVLLLTSPTSVTGHLNFDKEHPVTGEFRVSPLGNNIVYFTDNKYTEVEEPNTGIRYISEYNPVRVLDVTRQLEHIQNGGSESALYDNTNPSNISTLNLFLESGRIPEFKSLQILQGGGVESGTYFLGLAYADKDFTETNVLTLSNPVYIVPSNENTIPREIISGSPNEFQTNKSIKWVVNNLNADYKYVVPYIVQRIGEAEFVYKLEPIEINKIAVGNLLPNEVEIVYSGIENAAQSSLEEAVIDKVRYLTAKSIAQLDNRLYAANLTSRKDLGYQRFANSIQLTAQVETVEKFDPRWYDIFNINEGYTKLIHQDYAARAEIFPYIHDTIKPVQEGTSKGYRDVEELLFKKKSYRRGEVYAFYISFILKDGTESFAYHIPGRNVVAEYERDLMTSPNVAPGGQVNFRPGEVVASNSEARVFQYLDTSIIAPMQSTSFWENQNEFYPNTDDFDVWTTDVSGNPVLAGTLRGQKVRHHKLPSNKNATYSYVAQNDDFSTPNLNANTFNDGGVKFEEEVRILGIKLGNIRIPKFILEQIQGYKVYYAKRTQGNKTIIGQSGVHPSNPILAANLSLELGDAKKGPYFNIWYSRGDLLQEGITQRDTAWAPNDYEGYSVFKFHDFNLLRKKHTLATATHVDIQYIVTMQNWQGNYKGAQKDDDGYYSTFRAGHGDSEHAWVHPDLGNTNNFDVNEDDPAYDVIGPTSMLGNIFIGAKYWSPSNASDVRNPTQYLTNIQTVFTIAPESATYISGLSFLKNISATGFKGSSYIVNNAGESGIMIGLDSGLPALYGFGGDNWSNNIEYDYINKMPFVSGLTAKGRPNVYLVNLCSAKTDVFEPFDQQLLVSTGYYKSTLTVDTVTGEDTSNSKLNYYLGTESDTIFGGDTYIVRYGYRTTAQSFALAYFKKGDNAEGTAGPDDQIYGDIPFDIPTGYTGDYHVLWSAGNELQRRATIDNVDNWYNGDVNPYTTLYQFIIESDDNINFRHCGDVEKGVSPADSVYFDKFTAADVLYKSPLYDLTKMDNLLYEDQYSAQQDKRVTVPFPKKERSTNLFPNRVIRSNVQDGNFSDAYRYFLGLDYKDFAQSKGEINNIFSLDSLLYIHTQRSLFRTKGKQNLELADASQAFIGSGDLFAQEPDELVQSSEGFLGNYNLLSSLVTKDGYVFVSRKSRKIFLVQQKVTDLSDLGMDVWCRENIPFVLENYGINLDGLDFNLDAPTGTFGFITSYDPLFKRIIITKHELVPTDKFLNEWELDKVQFDQANNQFVNGTVNPPSGHPIVIEEGIWFKKSGWTISFSTDFSVWASRHSYVPPLYTFNSKYLYSFDPESPSNLFIHNNPGTPGSFYNNIYNFEFEFIYTGESVTSTSGAVSTTKALNKMFTSVSYVADVISKQKETLPEIKHQFSTGFDKFYVYNTSQISGYKDITYLQNIRKVDNSWVTNDFRDQSKIEFNTDMDQNQITVHGNIYDGTYTPTTSEFMFSSEGIINPSYIDLSKPWYEQRKFVDKFLAIRLISSNKAGNLINLYTAKAAYRISNR